jgi:hypothetical protein
LSARIGASFLTQLFRHACPAASSFEFLDSIGSATILASFIISSVSDGLLTARIAPRKAQKLERM